DPGPVSFCIRRWNRRAVPPPNPGVRKQRTRKPDAPTSPSDLRRDFGEDEVEHYIRHEKGQGQVEGLAADVQDEGLAAREVGGEFAEVGAQADGGEGEHEEPCADALFNAVD